MKRRAMRIDAHQHFWQPARGDYGWLTPALAPIFRNFLPADLAASRIDAAIDGTILVQAAPTLAETQYLLGLARQTDFVFGVVGWTDLESENAAGAITELAADPLLVGLRPMLHDIADPHWILRPSIEPAIVAMSEAGLVFDALVRPLHLPALREFAKQHPRLSIVIDHGAKPDIANSLFDPWRADIAMLATLPNVACKLSGLVTEAGPGWNAAQLRPCMQHLMDCFGPYRLLFGSDWPVCLLAASYAEWLAIAEAFLDAAGTEGHAQVMGENAARIYLLQRGKQEGRDAQGD